MPTLITCPHCANNLEWDQGAAAQLVACPFCAQQFTTRTAYPVAAPFNPIIPQVPPVIFVQSSSSPQLAYIPDKKSSGVAVLLAFFYPGLGQIYNGEVFKGLLLMLVLPAVLGAWFSFGVAVSLFTDNPGAFIAAVLLFVGATLAIWVWGMVDAHSTAEDINRRHRRRYGHNS
jgi:TM2 domain-containing membrane protein YozV